MGKMDTEYMYMYFFNCSSYFTFIDYIYAHIFSYFLKTSNKKQVQYFSIKIRKKIKIYYF